MKNSLKVLAGVAAAALVLGSSPALAATPTLSEVRVLPGPDASNDWKASALTPDGNTALISDGSGVWVDNIVSGASVEVTPVAEDVYSMLVDATGTYAYIPQAVGSFPTYTYQILKVDIASASVVATWTDPELTRADGQMLWAADGASFYLISSTGSHPNYETTVFEIDASTGATTAYGSVDLGYSPGSTSAFDPATGRMFIPQSPTNGGTFHFLAFDTSTNTFSNVSYSGTGTSSACAFAAGVLACAFDDTTPYLATFDASGAVTGSLTLDPAVDGAEAFALSALGTLGFVYGQASGSLNSIEVVDMTTLTSIDVLDTLLDYCNVIMMDPSHQAIWFTADYIADYDGGYQVLTYSETPAPGPGPTPDPEPVLANTGFDSNAAMMVATGLLFAGLSVVAIVAIRRRRA
jgi:LPXTG-motif cell wall-anchored protein